MSAAGALPPLREVMRRHGLEPSRALGQNFILDLNLTGRIARAGHPLAGRTVIEVGPGPGGLTRAILEQGATRLVAIERDRRCIAALNDVADAHPGRLEIIEGDALAIDVARIAGGAPVEIVSNLPYNIATPLIVGWLSAEPWPPVWTGMTLMVQREVAERIVAGPGSKTYGRLSVLAGARAKARIAFDVHPSAFVPPPRVVSSVVTFDPRDPPEPCALGLLERVTQAAFGQRRKMLRQSLRRLGVPPEPLLEAAGVRGEARAEEVPVAGFAAMARTLAAIMNDR